MVKAFAVIGFISIALTICAPEKTMSMDLTQFQWKNRLLFLFAIHFSKTYKVKLWLKKLK